MYLKYSLKNNLIIENIFIEKTDFGIRSALYKITGKNINLLLNESGNHRFTRNSPFSKNNKPHTSFVGVKVEKVINPEIININKNEISMTFFKGSGAGGQHRNKVETGVRLIHLPTGIMVETVAERSQHQNRDIAYERLLNKIYNYSINLKKQDQKNKWKKEESIGFGTKRRNYKLDQGFIKDEVSGNNSKQVDKILNGDLNIIV